MLPNFLIIGVQKAATSWLAACLQEHPDVFMSKEKEVHFFDKYSDKGQPWYEAHFADWAGQAAVGEATPDYINNLNASQRIYAMLGSEVKFILSLRHPIDRAHSAFWHRLRQDKISSETDFLTFYRQNEQFRYRGNYFTQLSRYLECYPRESFLILIYEELTKNGQHALADCFNFLSVDDQFVPQNLNAKVNAGGKDLGTFYRQAWGLRLRSRQVALKLLPAGLQRSILDTGRRTFERLAFEVGPKQRSFERLDDELRQELLADYMPEIRQLEEWLGRDLSIWYGSSLAA